MLLIFARRGRRVFQRLNLHQTAPLSTRVSPAVVHVPRVSRLFNARTPAVIQSINSSVSLLANGNTWAKFYATDAAGRGRPKAHTGRTTTKAHKKPAAKKAAKPKAKKELTPEQLEKKKAAARNEEIKKLKAATLKANEPKAVPAVPWPLFLSQRLLGIKDTNKADVFRSLSSEFKNLSSSELEDLKRQGEHNKQANEEAYAAWVNSYTPRQIKEANQARKRLASLTAEKARPVKLSQIKDERQVKRPASSFILFYSERAETGDLKHMSVQERAAHVKAEFDNLSPQQKETYTRKAEEDKERYVREYRAAYGIDPEFITRNERTSS